MPANALSNLLHPTGVLEIIMETKKVRATGATTDLTIGQGWGN